MNAIEKVEQQPAVVTPTQMLQLAVQQGADLAKLEKLMDLESRWNAEQAKKAYIAALSNFRRNCPIINRQQKGHNDRRYAGLADTLSQINSLLAENGLSHSWRTTQDGASITVTCSVTHAGGHSECTALTAAPDTTGNKNAIQAVGSTVSYLQRYTLFSILGLASSEQDDDGNAAGAEVDISRAVDELLAAQDMGELHDVFQRLWKEYPSKRRDLTSAKDQRKQELSA